MSSLSISGRLLLFLYIFFVFPLDLTIALYNMLFCRQSPFALFVVGVCDFSVCMICMFLVQLQLCLGVFQLNILSSLIDFRKCLSCVMNFRYICFYIFYSIVDSYISVGFFVLLGLNVGFAEKFSNAVLYFFFFYIENSFVLIPKSTLYISVY